MRNISEWAKKESCWGRAQALPVTLPEGLKKQLISKAKVKEEQKEARKVQKIDNGIEAQAPLLTDHALIKDVFPGAEFFSEKSGEPSVYRALHVNESGEQELVGYLFETPELPPIEIGYAAPTGVLVGMDLEGEGYGYRDCLLS